MSNSEDVLVCAGVPAGAAGRRAGGAGHFLRRSRAQQRRISNAHLRRLVACQRASGTRTGPPQPGRYASLGLQCNIIIVIITRFSCLEARCACRQAAVKAAQILPLVGLARSKQDPITRGHGAQYYTAPRQPGPVQHYINPKTVFLETLKR